MIRQSGVWTAAFLLAWSPRIEADEGGIAAQSGETLFAEGTLLALSYLRVQGSHAHGARELSHFITVSLLYGLDADTSLGLSTPYIVNEEDSGIGDTTLFLKRRLFFNSTDTWSFTSAGVVALQLPTGESTEDSVEPEMQPGSGSWDLFVGLAVTYEFDRFLLNGFGSFQRNNTGSHEFKHGDISVLGARFGWRPWMEHYPGPMLVLECGLQWEHEFTEQQDGIRLPNSGSDILFLTPRVQFSPRVGWTAALDFDLPIARRYRGEQGELDSRIAVGVSYTF